MIYKQIQKFMLRTNNIALLNLIYKMYYLVSFLSTNLIVKIISFNKAYVIKKSKIFDKNCIPGSSDIDIVVIIKDSRGFDEFLFLKLFNRIYPIVRFLFPCIQSCCLATDKELKLANYFFKQTNKKWLYDRTISPLPALFLLEHDFECIPDKYLLHHFMCQSYSGNHIRHYIKNVDKYMFYCNRKLDEFVANDSCNESKPRVVTSKRYNLFRAEIIKQNFFSRDVDADVCNTLEEILRIKFNFHDLIHPSSKVSFSFDQNIDRYQKDQYFNKNVNTFKKRLIAALPGIQAVLVYKQHFDFYFVVHLIVNPAYVNQEFILRLRKILIETSCEKYFSNFRCNKLKIDSYQSMCNKINFWGEESPFFINYLKESKIQIKCKDLVSSRHNFETTIIGLKRLLIFLSESFRKHYYNRCLQEGIMVPRAEIYEVLALEHFLEKDKVMTSRDAIKAYYSEKEGFLYELLNSSLPFSCENYRGVMAYIDTVLNRLVNSLERVSDEYM